MSTLHLNDTAQKASGEHATFDHELCESGNVSPGQNLMTGNSSVYLGLVADIGARVGQGSIHLFKSDGEQSDAQLTEGNINHEHYCASDSEASILPVVLTEEVPLSELSELCTDGSTSALNINDSGYPVTVSSQESPSLQSATVSASTLRDENRGVNPDDSLKLRSELDQVKDVRHSRPTDEEETPKDVDYACEDLPSSLPPSSSPPQLFSSSPYASSQSSTTGSDPSKMPVIETEDSHDCSYPNQMMASQDELRLESCHDMIDGVMSTGTDIFFSKMDPIPFAEGSLASSKKRVAYKDDADGLRASSESQPTKRPKLDSQLCLPPAPMRATRASHDRQFKKLAAPFRPPLKLPVARDEQTQSRKNRSIESDIDSHSKTEITRDEPALKEPLAHVLPPLQHKASNAPKPLAQFKSPLVNRVLPADARTIRLTPALQALERKLQLLKRAVKVKEDNEEEILVRLVEKWTDAGREVAYDLWDATKDAVNFGGKETLVRKSYGWEGSDGNMPWGWDNKPEDIRKESGDLDSSVIPCVTGRLAPEDDDDTSFNNTLGTMLRQVGIAPEIFGWDDDKGTFSD